MPRGLALRALQGGVGEVLGSRQQSVGNDGDLRAGALRLHTLRQPLRFTHFIQSSQVAAGISSPRLLAVISHHADSTPFFSHAATDCLLLFSSPTH